MPWRVSPASAIGGAPEGKRFAVVRSDTGEIVDWHETEEDAQAHVRALYANYKPKDAAAWFVKVAQWTNRGEHVE